MATYNELLEQKQELERQLEAARETELSNAIAKVRELMAHYDLSVEEVVGKKSSRSSSAPPLRKYHNPQTGETWAGRGRRPKWVEQALASGKNLDDLLVQQ